MKATFTITTILLYLCFVNIKTEAQLASGLPFTFSASTPSTAAVTPSLINLTNRQPYIRDDFDTLIRPFSWSFDLAGKTYTGFIVSTNGWIALAPASVLQMPVYFSSALPVNSLSNYAGGLPLIAPLWDDDSCTIIQYGVSSNILTVKWTIKWDKSYNGAYESLMWVTLDGNTGEIAFNYSNTSYIPGATSSASIGIAGICPGNFLSVTPNVFVPASTIDSVVEDSVINMKPIDAKFVFTPQVINNLIWQGATDTFFSTITNWGYCGLIPSCGVNARIPIPVSGNLPVLTSNQSVGNLVIDSGASLRIMAPFSLTICGDFINNGTFIADPGSTVIFGGSNNQIISGNFIQPNNFASLTINKNSGIVTLISNIDASYNFAVSNSASVFNINGKYMKVGGDFTNFNGATTIGISGSTIEFNGLSAQYYTNSAGADTLNHVTINKLNGKLYLIGVNSSLNIDSVLTLNSGNIVTSPTLEVNMLYGNASAIVSYSKDSYIDGRLRRKLWFGSIDFPVGDSLVVNQGNDRGYELANIAFTSSTVIPNLLAWFNPSFGPAPNGPIGPDYCSPDTITYSSFPLYDNGYWAFQRNSTFFNGDYDVTLFNTGGTNAASASLTVATAPITSNPYAWSSWKLIGTCFSPSTLAATKRVSFNSPMADSTSFNHLYSAAQGSLQIPNYTDELKSLNNVIISPNPNNGKFQVRFDKSLLGNYRLELTDVVGNKLISIDTGQRNMIDLELNEPAGIYFLNIYGDVKGVYKIVKAE